MASTVTVTGVVGPAQALTAGVFTNVEWFHVDTASAVLSLKSNGRILDVSIVAQNTFTVTKSGNTFTVTVSA